jgi:phenylacetate-coenzyme A ligase PaaK-like adenylate-forming protein
MSRFDDWVTDPALRLAELRRFTADPLAIGRPYLGRYMVWESSGSSGEPGVFVQDEQAMAVYDALEGCRRPALRPSGAWWNPWALAERSAFVGATGGHFASNVSVERLRRLNPAMASTMRSFSFLQPLPKLVEQLNEHAPAVLATYPSAASLLADEAIAGRLRIPLKELWTGGEDLSPSVREHVARAFGCPVSSSYGASEFLALAFECRCGRLHLNSDWAIVESVDEQRRPVPPGHTGSTCLLTNLANHVQPVIRYDLGDRVRLDGERCRCGSPLPVIEVEGRVDDELILQSPQGGDVRLLPLALTTVLEDEAGVFDFQLVQQGPSDLLLRLGPAVDGGTQALNRSYEALSGFLRQQGLAGVRLQARLEPGQRGRSGKVPRIVAGEGTDSAPHEAAVA